MICTLTVQAHTPICSANNKSGGFIGSRLLYTYCFSVYFSPCFRFPSPASNDTRSRRAAVLRSKTHWFTVGRRNLTPKDRDLLIYELVEARKKSHGGDRGNQYTIMASDQSGHLANHAEGSTRRAVAKEVSPSARCLMRHSPGDYCAGL